MKEIVVQVGMIDLFHFLVKSTGKMCRDLAFVHGGPLMLASGWLCFAAECNAGAADSQANPFVSCRLSLTTDSKRNGRLYRGLLFLVLHLIVLIHYITCLMPILPPHGFYFCSFSKAAKSCGFPLLSLSPPYYLNWSLLKLDWENQQNSVEDFNFLKAHQ